MTTKSYYFWIKKIHQKWTESSAHPHLWPEPSASLAWAVNHCRSVRRHHCYKSVGECLAWGGREEAVPTFSQDRPGRTFC